MFHLIYGPIIWGVKYLSVGSAIAIALLYGFSKVGNPFTPHGTGYKIIVRGDNGEIKDQNNKQLAHVEAKNNNVISAGGCESTVVICKNNRATISTLDGRLLVEFENQDGVIVIISFNKEEVSDTDIKQCFGKPAISLPVK